MQFDGRTMQLVQKGQGIYNLIFNSKTTNYNKFDQETLQELEEVLNIVHSLNDIKGLILSSAKKDFILGADITEFMGHFDKTHDELKSWLRQKNSIFNGFEDLDFPTVSLINGFSFGGGFEISLTTTYRVATSRAVIGLLESSLGIIPGWGGSIRLSRLCGVDKAIEWITKAKKYSADKALRDMAIDFIEDEDYLYKKAIDLIEHGQYLEKREQKILPINLDDITISNIEKLKEKIKNPHYPAWEMAVMTILEGSKQKRALAQEIECENFTKLAHTKTAKCLTQVFLADQYVKRISKKKAEISRHAKDVLVVGSGPMGAGIAYQNACKGVAVTLMDISKEALEGGEKYINSLVSKNPKLDKIPISYSSYYDKAKFDTTKIAFEAIIENEEVKNKVFKELEETLPDSSIIASNTSTISITKMGSHLKRPDKFCGMHFFNPVHLMPLVEVIRGKETSEDTINLVVEHVFDIGKKPIVVNDCAGFLVNRILFPYIFSFMNLLQQGIDFKRIDKLMTEFGFPMGPAYLLDVVGIEVAYHASKIMEEAYPLRMKQKHLTAFKLLVDRKRYGEKTKIGFYRYTKNESGKLIKENDPDIYDILKEQITIGQELTDEQIVERLMLPMIIEAAQCLEEKIVESPYELDVALIYALGFPPFRGGLLRYADDLGIANINKACEKYKESGSAYIPNQSMLEMEKTNSCFYFMEKSRI